MKTRPSFLVENLGEDALLLNFGDCIDVNVNAHVHALTRRLRLTNLPGLIDLVPAYASVLLRLDPLRWDDEAWRKMLAAESLDGEPVDDVPDAEPAQSIEIPVCYGGEFGPDLTALAAAAGIDADAAIKLHCAADYRVAMLGFAPGFPYLLGLPPALHASRRAEPRTRVPAGSVAIGGAQTGIYPKELPGGWQLIGRTPLRLFDLERAPPTLLRPGDHVRFRSIDAADFDALTRLHDGASGQ